MEIDPSSSLDKICELADIAGVKNRHGIVQEVYYSDGITTSDFKLLEVPKEVLTSLKSVQSVEIRGENEDDAVLCTGTSTFEVRVAFTSNCLLLTEQLSLPKSHDYNEAGSKKIVKVHGSLGAYYELKRTRPRLDKLKLLLWEAPYSGPNAEEESTSDFKYTFSDLQLKVQASDDELTQALRDQGALLINEHWRVLDLDYKERAFAQLLKLLEEKDWSYLEVPLEESCVILEALYPKFVTEHCLRLYGEVIELEEDTANHHVRLSEDKVCRFFAECILRGAGNFHYHEFIQVWKESVPDGMAPRDDHLKGLALLNLDSHPPSISHFSLSSLPEDPVMRFKYLFKVRSRWFREDIEPFLWDLVEPGQSLNALFVKYARCSTDATGRKVYNARKPVI